MTNEYFEKYNHEYSDDYKFVIIIIDGNNYDDISCVVEFFFDTIKVDNGYFGPSYISNEIYEKNFSKVYIRYSFRTNKISYAHLGYLGDKEIENCEKLFTINDIKSGLIEKIIKEGKYKPSYKPKKIERTLESFNKFRKFEKFDYNEIAIYIKDYMDIYKLKQRLREYYNIDIPSEYIDLFPNYVFINPNRRINNTIKIYLLTDNKDTFDEDVQKYVYDDEDVSPDILTIDDLDKIIDIIRYGNNYEIKPSYKPKKSERTLESNNNYTDYNYNEFVIEVYNEDELYKLMTKLKEVYPFDLYRMYYNKTFPNCYFINPNLSHETNELQWCSLTNSDNEEKYKRLYKKYILDDDSVNNDVFKIDELNQIINILKYGKILEPSYKPKKVERTLESSILEKSSLTLLGVPREVMQSIQEDFALPPDAEWERIKLKRDIEDILNNSDDNQFILQISADSIKVFVSYKFNQEKIYFIDSYIMKDTGWGGEYDKLKREFTSKTQLSYQINSRSLVYHLKSDFSLIKQPKRKEFKKEKEFTEFTENFKKDFLDNFNSILKRIVGMKYQDAKKEIKDKAKQVEIENEMMLSGLDDPLQGSNGLTILDEFLYQFEDEYSEFFGERIDLQELCNYFTRDKVLTLFMYYIYTGKIITK